MIFFKSSLKMSVISSTLMIEALFKNQSRSNRATDSCDPAVVYGEQIGLS